MAREVFKLLASCDVGELAFSTEPNLNGIGFRALELKTSSLTGSRVRT